MMDIQQLLESIDAVDYISQFVELEEKNGEFWGLSPFKSENTPSFSVRRETGKFYDFSSGLGGTLVCFVKNIRRCSGDEAVRVLKEYAGYDGEITTPKEKHSTTQVCRKFRRPRQTHKQSKGTTLPDTHMERYEKRQDKLKVWMNEGISKDSLEKFQVRYDSLSDRLVYPIRNLAGKIVNVGGRTLDPDWKAKGLRKYTYFFGWDGGMGVVFGLFDNMKSILEKKEVILFEGCKSVLLANTWGIYNTGAILTSHLSPMQMKILARLGCRVVFALDKEVNIREDHNIQKLKNYVEVEYLWDREDLLDEKDAPVDKGEEVFRKLYESRLKYRR